MATVPTDGAATVPVSAARALFDGHDPAAVQHGSAARTVPVTRCGCRPRAGGALVAALTDHRFLVLTVAQRYLLRAEDELVRRFAVTRMSLESMLLQEMKATASGCQGTLGSGPAGRCGHARALTGDACRPWCGHAMPAVEQALLTATGPVLLVYPGLLARYDQIQLLERLREASGRQHDAPGFIVLIAADEQRHMPVLDGKPIPVILASEWARIGPGWRVRIQGGKQLPTSQEQ